MPRGLRSWITAALLASGVACTRTVPEESFFYPRRLELPAETEGLSHVTLEVEEGVSIRGVRLSAGAPRPLLIYFYGNAATVVTSMPHLRWVAEQFGVDVLAMDYRGYGESDGHPRFADLLEDAVRLFDAQAARHPLPVYIWGRSIGSVPATHLAARRPVAGLILEAPVSSAPDLIERWNGQQSLLLRWLVRVELPSALAEPAQQPVNVIRGYEGPLLVIHGDADRTVPAELGRRVLDAGGGEDKTWCPVAAAGHNDLSLQEGAALDCLTAMLTGAPGSHAAPGPGTED